MLRDTDSVALALRESDEQPVNGTSAIRTEIHQTRARVLAAMDDLHEQWGEVTNWRRVFARRPMAWLLGAAGVGLVIGLLVPRTRSRRLEN